MEEIIQKYGYIIYNRGVEYYKDKRVQQVLKFKNKLYGKVMGSFVYDVVVDLKSLESKCSCPYGHNCKHGVATILCYMNNEYVDVDKIVDKLKCVDKEKLLDFILEKIGRNPEFALNFVGLLDDGSELSYIYKRVKNKLLTYIAIMKSGTYIDKNTAKEIGNFLLENKNFLSKEDLIEFLEVVIKEYENYGGFYDDYTDYCYEELVLEPLGEVLFDKDLECEDLVRIFKLYDEDDYGLMEIIYDKFLKKADKFSKCVEMLKDYLDEYDYIELLIKLGKTDEALNQIHKSKLEKSINFELLTEIDENKAIDYGIKNKLYENVVMHYYGKNYYDKIVELFRKYELADYVSEIVYNSIIKSEPEDEEDLLTKLFFKTKNIVVKYNIAMKLNNKEMLLEVFNKLCEKGRYNYYDYEFLNVVNKLLLQFNEKSIINKLKDIILEHINMKTQWSYEMAVELLDMIRKSDYETFREMLDYIKKEHYRKRNLMALINKKKWF
ncbi:SWIM zinc finger family protein [Methanotorris igneus]|uniref:SWIM-type domain-containing protein n=1 Tax=Methanotorris igneus (strain DSM 5666 / JCM 11834 / Kol 5) TaxID=880724 RepID=F6BCZ2_METIK|nr:SWIM zinc finger family protein [Methanotorris igneus]AEF96353.1 hypothetical protein Metig_0808 [Methanotorris igneus Kol 5]